MRNLMKVEEANCVCKDRSKWEEIDLCLHNGKRAWCYVCRYVCLFIYIGNFATTNIPGKQKAMPLKVYDPRLYKHHCQRGLFHIKIRSENIETGHRTHTPSRGWYNSFKAGYNLIFCLNRYRSRWSKIVLFYAANWIPRSVGTWPKCATRWLFSDKLNAHVMCDTLVIFWQTKCARHVRIGRLGIWGQMANR
jgi:hypothetical protein